MLKATGKLPISYGFKYSANEELVYNEAGIGWDEVHGGRSSSHALQLSSHEMSSQIDVALSARQQVAETCIPSCQIILPTPAQSFTYLT